MQTLDQVRAKNALDCCKDGAGERDVRKRDKEGNNLSGYPSLIINNGLLATLAFSIDKGGQHQRIANALAYHLKDRKIGKIGGPAAEALRDALTCKDADALLLRRATDESLAFLAFLKRFAS